jgi:hypothetical protein
MRSTDSAPGSIELPASFDELLDSFDELLELLRFPGEIDLESFVWEQGTRFHSITLRIPKSRTRPAEIDLDKLVAALIAHFNVEPEPERISSLRAGLEMADLPFKGQLN